MAIVPTSASDFVSTHRGLIIGGGVILILVVAGRYLTGKSGASSLPASSQTAFGDLSGLQPGGLVYVPTQTSFTTENQSGVFASNDPLLQTISNTGFNTTTTTTTTKTGAPGPQGPPGPPVYFPPGPKPRKPPPPSPPPRTNGQIEWGKSWHTVRGGETLSSIAAAQTRYMRGQGMPGSMSITWHDLWAHNQGVISKYANQHGHRTDVWNWIFPGEVIVVPIWGR